MNLGVLLMAIGIYFFKAPNSFATGGVSGVAIILANVFPVLTQSVYMMIINVLLLIVGVIVLGRECGLLTIYCSLMLSIENSTVEESFNDSLKKVDDYTDKEISRITKGLPLPGLN